MFLNKLNQKGSSLVGAIVVMVILGAAAASVATLSSSDSVSTADNVNLVKARAVGNAGLQRALNQLNYGYSPDIQDMEFGIGSFDTTTDPSSSLVTVVATVGKATVTQSINADFARNCVNLHVDEAYGQTDTIYSIKLTKLCNQQAILSKIHLSWNESSCALNLGCDGSVNEEQAEGPVYEDVGDPPNNKFWICHVPPGNPENAQTLAVNEQGWLNGHSGGTGAHSLDYLGPCIISNNNENANETITTCEVTNESQSDLANCATDEGNNSLIKVEMADTTIFEAGSLPSENTLATSSGEETDVANAVMTANGNYYIDLEFANNLTMGTWYTITTEFADGSMLTKSFKLGSQTEEENNNNDEENNNNEEQNNEEEDGFEVENGVVVVEPGYEVNLVVLGSAITCGAGGQEIFVRSKLCINNNCAELWNYNDVDGGESHDTSTDQANSDFSIEANAYRNSCANFTRTVNSTNTLQVKTLTNGQQAPPLAGFGGQKSVQDFLEGYLDENGNVTINSDQVIMLFELGVDLNTNPNSTAADFQDLVILMTITETEE